MYNTHILKHSLHIGHIGRACDSANDGVASAGRKALPRHSRAYWAHRPTQVLT